MRLITVIALALAAAGCGGSTNHAKEYPPGAGLDFITRCAQQPNASFPGCTCIFTGAWNRREEVI